MEGFSKTLVVVGDGFVGKTTLIQRFSQKIPPGDYRPTVIDNFAIDINVRGRKRNLMIWDTSGQEDWAHIRKLAYPGTDLVLLVFDISDRSSLDNVLMQWYPEVCTFCPKVPFILVGNKTDLRGTRRDTVDYSEGALVAKKICAKYYLESSALDGEGIDTLINKMAHIVFMRKSCSLF